MLKLLFILLFVAEYDIIFNYVRYQIHRENQEELKKAIKIKALI